MSSSEFDNPVPPPRLETIIPPIGQVFGPDFDAIHANFAVNRVLAQIGQKIDEPREQRPQIYESSGATHIPTGELQHYVVKFSDYAWLGSAESSEEISLQLAHDAARVALRQQVPDQLTNFGPAETSLRIVLKDSEQKRTVFFSCSFSLDGSRDWHTAADSSGYEHDETEAQPAEPASQDYIPNSDEIARAARAYATFADALAQFPGAEAA